MAYPDDFDGRSWREVSDGIKCPRCGTEMGFIEEDAMNWLNYCRRCGYTSRR